MILLLASLLVGIAAVVLALTAERWLSGILGLLDRVLGRLGVGTWSARALTEIEKYVAERTAEKRCKKRGESQDELP